VAGEIVKLFQAAFVQQIMYEEAALTAEDFIRFGTVGIEAWLTAVKACCGRCNRTRTRAWLGHANARGPHRHIGRRHFHYTFYKA